MFLYKEDFNKFLAALTETINYVKTELMPDFDFDAYNHDQENDEQPGEHIPTSTTLQVGEDHNMDDWKI